jgi:hypothetical protein
MKKVDATFHTLYNHEAFKNIRDSDFDGNKFLQFETDSPIFFRGSYTTILTIDDASTSVECETFEELFMRLYSNA